MKITKDAGEHVSPAFPRRIATEIRSVLAVSGTGTALWHGSLHLISRGWDLLGSHFSGWEKGAALAATGYVTVYATAQSPDIARFAVPIAVIVWCIAAWWVAPPAPRGTATDESTVTERPQEQDDELTLGTLADVVRRVAENRQGAHLADLLQQPEFQGWKQPDLKAAITRLGTPVEEFKLILAGRQRVRDGVRLRDLPAPAATDPAPAPSSGPPVEAAPRPGQTPAPDPE